MQAKKIGILLLCGMLAACVPGCGKNKAPYATTEQAEDYEKLKNIKIYSDTSTDSADSDVTISGRSDTDSSKAESAITSGGSADSKPTGTPAPSGSTGSTGGNNSSGGSSGAAGAGTWPDTGWVSSGGGGSSSGDPFVSGSGENSGSASGSGGQASSASSSPATIIKSIEVNETQIADKNGVSVVATGTSDNGIDITVTNTNSRPVKVLIDNVIVNNRRTGVNTKVEVPANGQVRTSIPLTDAVLQELNISRVHDITVDVDISNRQEAQTAPENAGASSPSGGEADPGNGENPQTAENDVQDTSGAETSSGGGGTHAAQDPGPLIASYDGLNIYATYVKNDFIFNSGLLITVENATGRHLRLTSDSVVVNGDQSAGGIMMDAGPGTTQVCFNVGSSKLFSNAREITLNLKTSERFTAAPLYETGDVTIQAG